MADWGDKKFAHPVKAIRFIHNTVYNNGTPRWGGGMVFENTDVADSEIASNILSQNSLGQFHVAHGKMPAGVTIKGNVIDGVSEQMGDNVVASVQFADPAHGDFKVVSGPKEMDAGAKVSAIDTNFISASSKPSMP